ncbi:membrane protein [Actinomyces sp. Chiba101]|uniref:hypothetical protein n=1 Tax=Actinomyces TaxID=1654 RepID=UPI000974F290|nr:MULTISPECIES: hypothetical protein [Actinomyces]BAW93003.1 membrane protein [Actinomyces sp. Chiba101]GAV94013.1 hypothetical protein ADENT20671_0780 [Actinomyces denticolens]SUU05664.1 Uncharacterised protein [Actinomyces denticolens]
MSAPEYPLPSITGKPVPAWRLPTVTVEDHTTPHGVIVSVTQRVPARVAEVRARTDWDDNGHRSTRVTRRYESGLGSPGALPLVPERFTVLAPGGNAQAIHSAVDQARSAFQPRGYRSTQAMTPGTVNALLSACFALVFCGMGAGMLGALIKVAHPAPATPGPFKAVIVVIGAGFLLFLLVGLGVLTASARRLWLLRTPPWVAEDQWLALRQALATATGSDPASSRPVDVEAGMTRDLLMYPAGTRLERGTTADGRMGPAWPDAGDITRMRRSAMGRAIGGGLAVCLFGAVFSLMAGLILGAMGNTALPLQIAILCFAVGFLLMLVKDTDRVILAHPRVMPTQGDPRELRIEEVDLESLRGWCEARHREDLWGIPALSSLAGFGAGILYSVLGSFLGLPLFTMRGFREEPTSAELARTSLIGIGVIGGTIVLTTIIGVIVTRRKHASRRARAEELMTSSPGAPALGPGAQA